MEYRELGGSGEKVSTIGMGTWRVGVFTGSEGKSQQIAALRRGVELGMNLIDTAEMYAAGRSEEVVGEAVRPLRKDVFIATKVSPDNLHHDDVIAACEGSLRRLGTTYIDLYQVHWPNPAVPIKETMSAMEALVDQGKVRHVGVSNFSVEETEEARSSLSKIDIVSNQVEYSLNVRSPEHALLPYLAKEKLTLIAYSPLVRGHISARLPEDVLAKYHLTPAQAMLNWVTRSDQVIAIPKATNIGHLQEDAASVSARLTDAEYQQISRS